MEERRVESRRELEMRNFHALGRVKLESDFPVGVQHLVQSPGMFLYCGRMHQHVINIPEGFVNGYDGDRSLFRLKSCIQLNVGMFTFSALTAESRLTGHEHEHVQQV